MNRKWIGIRVSAGLTIAGSLATLALGVLMVVSTRIAPQPTGPDVPPLPVATIGMVMAAIMAAFSGWGIWTAVAIFRRRGWARVSIIIFAMLLAFMGVGGGLAILVLQLPPQQEGAIDVARYWDAVRYGIAGFYGVLAALAAWWLVLFNLKSTKEYFAQGGPSEPGARPLSISVIAWFLLAGALFLVPSAAIRFPAFVFGTVITGWGAVAVYIVFAAANVYLGIGLLRLREQARLGTIVYMGVMALNSLLTMAPPGYAAKMQILQKEMPRFFPAGTPVQMPQPAWVFVVMGMVFVAIPVWFLVRRRDAFGKS